MRFAPFAHHAPRTVPEALALLAEHGEAARILAGGQSLLPVMAFRMARPAVLVDINQVAGLDGLAVRDGRLEIGARVRHATLERPVEPGPLGAFLARVARHIAHPPIRARGTLCGSLAHADPAAEWGCAALALGARVSVEGPGGAREIAAEDWFQGVFATALAPGEMVTAASFPLPGPGWRLGFAEFSRRAGDYALAMAAVALRLEAGVVAEARVALGGVGGRPELSPGAAAALLGQDPRGPALDAAAAAAAAGCDAQSDLAAPAEHRRELVAAMVKRAVRDALA